MTTEQWLRAWYTTKTTAGTLRPTTARCYRQQLQDYLIPYLGSMRLSRLRGAHITATYAGIIAERNQAIAQFEHAQRAPNTPTDAQRRPPRRPRTFGTTSVIRLHATLHAALNAAVRAGEIPVNPAKHAEVPRRKRPKVTPWSPAEYGAFLDYLQDTRDPMAELFRLAGHAGLRRGELCGLRWTDVDLARRMLVVRRQIVEVGSGLLVGKPKTHSGEDRIVDLDIGTVRMPRHLRARQRDQDATADGPPSGYVFTGPHRQPWHPTTLTHRFRRLTSLTQVRRCRLHDLRHLSASLQLAAGVDLAIVSKRLGHSTYTITADTYCHLLPGVGRGAAEAAARMIPRRKHPSAT